MIRRPPRSTLFSLLDALPIYRAAANDLIYNGVPDELHLLVLESPLLKQRARAQGIPAADDADAACELPQKQPFLDSRRSEEHTSELQSRQYFVCRLLLQITTI